MYRTILTPSRYRGLSRTDFRTAQVFAANNTTSNDSNFTPEVEEPNATKVYTLTNRTVLTVHSKIRPFDAQTLPLPRSRVRSGKRNKHASKTGNRR